MSVKQAAIQVLRESGEPLHSREITKRILQKKLWTTQGKTPAATVEARLSFVMLFVLPHPLQRGEGGRGRESPRSAVPNRLHEELDCSCSRVVPPEETIRCCRAFLHPGILSAFQGTAAGDIEPSPASPVSRQSRGSR